MSRDVLVASFRGDMLRTAIVRVDRRGSHVTDAEDLAAGARSKFAGRGAVFLLEEADRSVRHFVLPPASAQNARRMAALQAEQRLPPMPDGYVLDTLVAKSGDSSCALVVALPRARLEARADRLRQAGLVLDSLAIEPLIYASLAPAKGRVAVRVTTQSGEMLVACRDGLPVGWTAGGAGALVEEFLAKTPCPFEASATIDACEAGRDPSQTAIVAAAQYSLGPQRMPFEAFVRREDEVPASRRQLAVCGAVLCAAFLLLAGAAWSVVLKAEAKRDALRENAEQMAQVVRLSEGLIRECGRLTSLTSQLRSRTEDKPLASATVRRLTDLLPSGVRLTAVSFGSQGQVMLDCEASDARAPILFLDLLRNTPDFRNPVLEYYSDRGQDRLNFRVTCGARQTETREEGVAGAGARKGKGAASDEAGGE